MVEHLETGRIATTYGYKTISLQKKRIYFECIENPCTSENRCIFGLGLNFQWYVFIVCVV